MHFFPENVPTVKRLPTLEVKVGELLMGNFHPIRIQTMTTTDTMNTLATVEECIRCIHAGAELVRITAPSKKEAENLLHIKNELRKRGYTTPLVADIHFTPNAADIAARIVEKVRINPGNYADKKKFEQIDYTDSAYQEELDRIRERFTPLLRICKEYGTAMRIGTNHGSLSDRIMSRYGDTAIGMVESAMEFLRMAEDEQYYNIVLSMKSSNPLVMVDAYQLLVEHMQAELGHLYPLHLGVTEAGDGEDGRIKSAMGIGTLLEEGIGDTIRVSLTEDPEFELPVCKNIIKRYPHQQEPSAPGGTLYLNPIKFNIKSGVIGNIGGEMVPVVVADVSEEESITPDALSAIGYQYQEALDKWNISDTAADFVYCGKKDISFPLPGTLKCIYDFGVPAKVGENKNQSFRLLTEEQFLNDGKGNTSYIPCVLINCDDPKERDTLFHQLKKSEPAVLVLQSALVHGAQNIRKMYKALAGLNIAFPVVLKISGRFNHAEERLIHYSIEAGALLMEGIGNGLWLHDDAAGKDSKYRSTLNSVAFGILQASRKRISKTEYISCPSCGRTLFDLQTTTAKIRAVTNHLKGVKIAIMGCIVNGPGEMADADFGYVGSGPGKITLYKQKEVVKRNVPAEIAVEELIHLLKENNVWVDPPIPVHS